MKMIIKTKKLLAFTETAGDFLRAHLPYFIIFTYFFVINSFVCDDAFITFRTVDNFVRGFGLTWNVFERVQVYTHPLWMLLHSAIYFFIKSNDVPQDPTKFYYLTLGLSYIFSLSALSVLFQIVKSQRLKLLTFSILLSSKAFMDFTSSGLENPLAYFLISLFFLYYIDFLGSSKINLLLVTLILSLVSITRYDLVLIIILPYIHVLYKLFKVGGKIRSLFKSAILGFIPSIAWFSFSLIYYGFFFPNTFYAKMNLGLDFFEILFKTLTYVFRILSTDPITVILVFSIPLISFVYKRYMWAGLSVFFYIMYVMTTGGDFMGGRFFSVVFLASVLLIAMSHGSLMERYSKEILCAIVAYNIFSVSVPLKAQNDPPGNNDKSYYFAASNLIKARSDHKFPFSTFHVMTDEQYCKNLRELSPKVEFGGGGINGFCRGPKKALLDPQSITDPLFSRLSVELTPNYTVGHFMKTPPIGYLESVKAKENLILDPDLRIFYEKILLITQGKIFDSKRWKAIFELNFINPKFQKYSEEWKCSFEC